MNTTNIGKYKITYNNSKEFHTLKSEIFSEECYSIDIKNKTNPYIIDVGAYIGLSIIYFKNIYPNSNILAFEPNPYAREILEENIFNNNIRDIEILPYAVDINEGKRSFYIDSSRDKWHSTGGFLENSWNNSYRNEEKITVETKRLSKYLNKHVDLLKIDVEGSEEKILKEIQRYLENVDSIIMEYHPIKKKNLKKILTILQSKNFSVSFFKDGREIKSPDYQSLLILKCSKV